MQLEVGKKYHVIVINIVQSGAVVELDDKSTALIHISRISDSFVADIRDFVEIRGEYEALGVEGFARPVELSLKHLNLRKAADKTVQPVKPARKEYSQPAKQARKPIRQNKPTTSRPADVLHTFAGSHSCQTLDDMIAASNKDLRDKIGCDPSRMQGKRRKGGRKEY